MMGRVNGGALDEREAFERQDGLSDREEGFAVRPGSAAAPDKRPLPTPPPQAGEEAAPAPAARAAPGNKALDKQRR